MGILCSIKSYRSIRRNTVEESTTTTIHTSNISATVDSTVKPLLLQSLELIRSGALSNINGSTPSTVATADDTDIAIMRNIVMITMASMNVYQPVTTIKKHFTIQSYFSPRSCIEYILSSGLGERVNEITFQLCWNVLYKYDSSIFSVVVAELANKVSSPKIMNYEL